MFTFKKVVYICKVNKAQKNLKTRIMKRFSKSKTYLDKEGNRYHYDGKYRGFYQFYKFLENRTAFNTYSERELLKLELTEK